MHFGRSRRRGLGRAPWISFVSRMATIEASVLRRVHPVDEARWTTSWMIGRFWTTGPT
jgi:hypothetical protein